jgi:hypothetical protein
MSPDQIATEIEEIADCSMGSHQSLGTEDKLRLSSGSQFGFKSPLAIFN